jgi:hypothetical protein
MPLPKSVNNPPRLGDEPGAEPDQTDLPAPFWRRWLWGDRPQRPRFRQMRSIVLRALGIIYVCAYGSLAVQVDGLIGSRGIWPVGEFLNAWHRAFGTKGYGQLPTIFWLNASDTALQVVCWGGVVVGALMALGFWPRVSLAVLWAGYLSLVVVGQEFLGYQWDGLLLETGLLAVLLAPGGWWLGQARREPSRIVVGLFHWLLFRLMFLSGVVKLTSNDPTWWSWRALDYHYETQPLPTWTSWYIHQSPAWFQRLSVGFMFWCELIAPFLIFTPRRPRMIGFASLVTLQVLILATGNYGFFNLLSIVLCLSLVEDRDWGRLPDDPTEPARGGWRRVAWGIVAVAIVLVTALEATERAKFLAPVPWPAEALRHWVSPLRSFNAYGLFAVMTTQRFEIEVEGSDDGLTWYLYRFRWKPDEPDRRPRFTTPHMPRLDWQMWFAALRPDCRSQPWFLRFEQRLLEGSEPVLRLLRENPFAGRRPRYIRARLYLYHFTRWGSRDWWERREVGTYCPTAERPASERASAPGEPPDVY